VVVTPGYRIPAVEKVGLMAFLLWIIAVVLVIAGIISLVKRDIIKGVALIVIGLLVGPGGVSIFT